MTIYTKYGTDPAEEWLTGRMYLDMGLLEGEAQEAEMKREAVVA